MYFNKIHNNKFNINSLLICIIIKLQFMIKLINSASLQCLPCDTRPKSITAALPSSTSALTSKTYEEFLFEHQVTKQEAINALNKLNHSFFEDSNKEPGCKAIPCTDKVIRYCSGSQFLNDHCWCEQGHGKEGLPWVPHTCYIGEKQYTASVGSCYFFNEVKECCCSKALAKQWKSILSSSSIVQNRNNLIFAAIVFLTGYLQYRKFIFPT